MNKIGLLLKIHFMGRFGINKVLHSNNKKEQKKYASILLLSILGIMMGLAYWTVYCYIIDENMRTMGINSGLLAVVFAVVGIICLTTTVYKGTGILFNSEDFSIVMPLPIKMSEMVTAKLTTLYLSNLIFVLGLMLPAMGIYVWREQPGILFYIYGMITLLVAPIIPMIIATAIGMLISIVSARFKRHNLISIVLMIAVFIGIMLFIFRIGNMGESDLTQMVKMGAEVMGKIYPMTPLFIRAVCEYSLLDLLGLVLISLGCFGVFVGVIGANFQRIHTLMNTSRTTHNYRLTKLQTTSPIKALYKREIRRYIASPNYVMNTGVGMLMLLIMVGVLVFQKANVEQLMMQIPEVARVVPILVCLMIAIAVVMTDTTAISISLEGKYFEMLKGYPVSIMQIFVSKMMVNWTVTVPVIAVVIPIMGIVCHMSWLQIVMSYLFVGAYAVLGPLFGIIINLILPKLEWDNEITVIKQSMASLLGVLGAIPLVLLSGVGILLVDVMDPSMILLLLAAIVGVLDIVLYRLLKTWGVRKFYEL
ncbi:MAG: hypothetical protein ACRCTE_14185 [Cellulosilyticaceae bacterium]